MARQFEIEFEKGGKFIASLLEDKAPKTGDVVWDALPISEVAGHSSFSGKIVYLLPKEIRFSELENPKVFGLIPGDIVYNSHYIFKTPLPHEIAIVYGEAVPFDVYGWVPLNHFAKITKGSLEELVKVGTRIRQCGRERVTLRKKV